jgi:hypothetical protein
MGLRRYTWIVPLCSVLLTGCATPHTAKAVEARNAGQYDVQLDEVRNELLYPSSPGQDHMLNVYVMGIDAIANCIEHHGKRASELDEEAQHYYASGRSAAVSIDEKHRLEQVMERYRAVSER